MALAPKSVPLSKIDDWDDSLRQSQGKKLGTAAKIMQLLTLGGHLIPSFMLKKSVSAFPLTASRYGNAFMHKKTIQYQKSSDFGYEYNRSVKSFFKWSFKSISLSFKILFTYGRAKRSFKNSKELLTSEAFWKKHLN